MSRFRPMDQLQQPPVTRVTSSQNTVGYAAADDKSLINNDSDVSVTSVTGVTTKTEKAGGETGGGVAVATEDIFRARLQQAAHDLPVNLAVLAAEFANDAEDIAEYQIDDATLRKAVHYYVVYHLGLQPLQDSTPADDGMVQCRQCGYWWNRCRHPDKFRGRWPDMAPDRWRRCREYQAKAGGRG